ncbi:MAG TPA: M20/M25/M40 family metallo-hydrolase, partial [Pyrinomonadaceae bacterium]|nr:M20/M25/M40 family metallo-hydrolase [Pyrinomonadaceae bacterium]
MRYKFSSCLLVVVLLASSAFAQQATTTVKNSPDAERLREHVTYLASGKLDGRRTGTPGAELAAGYIAAEFERLGLRSGANTGTRGGGVNAKASAYMQPFPYVVGVELGKNNAMNFFSLAGGATTNAASLDLRLREDWMPLGWSTNGRAEKLPVTFVGYGISAADLNHDDYAGMDVRGRVALALAGTPDGDNPHGQFARYAELRFKATAARDRGVKALVLISGEENFRDERLARLRYDHGSSDAGVPIVVISRQAARRIFEAAGVEPAFDKTTKPADVNTNSIHPESAASAGGTSHAQTPPVRRSASAPLPNVALSITVDAVRRERPAHNVVGVLEGSDPNLKNESIIIGAHYDHLGRGGQGSLARREGEIHHGADDNASGTAGLIELARLFAGERTKLRRTIVFVAFGGEEEGLLGSNFYVNNPAVPLTQTVAMINMDMIGRLKEDRLMIGGAGTASEWRGWIERINADANIKIVAASGVVEPASVNVSGGEYPVVVGANGRVMATANPRGRFALTLSEDGFGPSDHSSFYAKKIPVLFFFTGTHEDYHKPSDTAEKINYTGEARVLSFVREIVSELQASERRPTYAVARSQSAGRSAPGFRVYLGTVPNYADSTDGMKLDAVRDDSPAAKAGLRTGDVVVKLAGREIRNVYDYTYALGEMKAG